MAVKKLKYFAGGRWLDSKCEKYMDVYNPSTGEVIAQTPCCTKEEVNEAIACAKEAFKSLRKSDFVFMSADIRDAEGIPNYAAIVVRLDNPRLTSVIAEFTETVQLLSQKPE